MDGGQKEELMPENSFVSSILCKDEDVNDADEGTINKPKKIDYMILDELISFLDTTEDVMLPVLCGYFNKIFVNLMAKESIKMTEYLFVHRKGDIYAKLLQHMNQHSIV